ncbi:MAG: phosphoribosylanthranilate isomerase [Gammaproteobacteria bacterium]|nr:phosphoribosylanthranilate isomerase [Gammaproteobacteria bacterium]
MRTRVKICGLTRTIDVHAAIQAGADAVGFVFYPPSPRFVTAEQATQLVQFVPPFVQPVGLFVDVSEAELLDILKTVRIDLLQFHGNETPEQCQHLAALTGKRWIKALQMKPDVDIYPIIESYRAAGASGILLDAWHPDLFGGTGHAFDWRRFPQYEQTPNDTLNTERQCPLILAGGLTPDNVADAIRQTHPFAVDVSGGVESAKGIKDSTLIQHFIAATKLP